MFLRFVFRFVVVVVSLFLNLNSEAGNSIDENFNIITGYPFENIYDLEIDNAGQVWMGYQSGIARYNGHSFSFFDCHDCHDNDFIKIEPVSANVVFAINYYGELVKFTNGLPFKEISDSNRVIDFVFEDDNLFTYVVNDLGLASIYSYTHDGYEIDKSSKRLILEEPAWRDLRGTLLFYSDAIYYKLSSRLTKYDLSTGEFFRMLNSGDSWSKEMVKLDSFFFFGLDKKLIKIDASLVIVDVVEFETNIKSVSSTSEVLFVHLTNQSLQIDPLCLEIEKTIPFASNDIFVHSKTNQIFIASRNGAGLIKSASSEKDTYANLIYPVKDKIYSKDGCVKGQLIKNWFRFSPDLAIRSDNKNLYVVYKDNSIVMSNLSVKSIGIWDRTLIISSQLGILIIPIDKLTGSWNEKSDYLPYLMSEKAIISPI